jgi:hypothetical protein
MRSLMLPLVLVSTNRVSRRSHGLARAVLTPYDVQEFLS